jgi:cytoskeletal protein CcmA (bactofilin family)
MNSDNGCSRRPHWLRRPVALSRIRLKANLKIVGSVTAEGLVEVNGQVEGDLRCTSLIVSPKAYINGRVQAERVVVKGKIEGPIYGGEVVLKSRAIVVGDIQTESLYY